MLALCVVWVVGGAVPSSAATRLFAGYDFLRQQATDERDAQTRHGFTASADRDFFDRLGFKAQFGYGSRQSADVKRSHTLIVGGPVFHVLRGDRVGLFVHALGGAVRSFEELDAFGVLLSTSRTHPAFVAGGGVDVAWRGGLLARVQGGYIVGGGSPGELGRMRAFHVSAGLAFRFGER